jgi:beta-glucanase (GH16 family)
MRVNSIRNKKSSFLRVGIFLCFFIICQYQLSAQIIQEAEAFIDMSGIQLENTADVGGGLNVGYIDLNDWLQYEIEIPLTGDYQLSFRIASLSGGGTIDISDETTSLGTVSVTSTGDWQAWKTIEGPNINFTQGLQKIRLTATSGGFNLNWLQLTLTSPVDTDIPTKPVIFESKSDGHSITLSWNPSEDNTSAIAGYSLYNNQLLIANTKQTTFSLTKLSPEKTFNLSVQAYDLAGNRSDLSQITLSTLALNWPLVWADEFDGTAVNTNNWNYQVGGDGWGNGEAQYYTDGDNASVSDGLLIIEARKETIGSNNYTSSRMNSNGKFDFKYGRIEVRATLPSTKGTWPAIWTLPTNWIYGGWPDSGEIDIMEHSATYGYGDVFGTIHTKAYNHILGTQRGGGVTYDDVTNTFHTYALEWYPDHLDWYFDDELVFTFDNEYKSSAEWPFDNEHHLLLNVAIGGGLGGDIDANGVWPQQMAVDFVRMYEFDLGENDDVAPSAPTNLQAEVSGISIDLSWDLSIDNNFVEQYYIYLDGEVMDSTSASRLTVASLEPFTTYVFGVQAKDFGNNSSEQTSLTVTTGEISSVAVPGRFEAEDYLSMLGMQSEACEDIGGGENMGFINTGDWLEYGINVQEAGIYTLSARTAAQAVQGSFQLRDKDENVLTTVTTPITGGWQNWETVSSSGFQLSAGIQRIRIQALAQDFNLNWFEIKSDNSTLKTALEEAGKQNYQIYPNPINGKILTIRLQEKRSHVRVKIHTVAGKEILVKRFTNAENYLTIDRLNLSSGLYLIRIEDSQGISNLKFMIE